MDAASVPLNAHFEMQAASHFKLVANQLLMADHVLGAFTDGSIPLSPDRYRELADWIRESFSRMGTSALQNLRDDAPAELRGILENVLHERQAVDWNADAPAGRASVGLCLALLDRCRFGPR
jgi:hypothetical protein